MVASAAQRHEVYAGTPTHAGISAKLAVMDVVAVPSRDHLDGRRTGYHPTKPLRANAHCQRLSVTIRRPIFARAIAAAHRPCQPTRHGTVATPRPLLCQVGRHQVVCNSWALPLRDGSCDRIACDGVLENVRDDEAFVAELARVIRPGGQIVLHVPSASPLAWLDAFNLYHYLVEISRRGKLPLETDEVGWRRHYALADLKCLLTPAFCVRTITASGIGLAEGGRFVALMLFRWLLRRNDLYLRCIPIFRMVERIEGAIRLGRFSTRLTVVAERTTAGLDLIQSSTSEG